MGKVMERALRRRLADEDDKKVEGLAVAERAKPLRSPVLIIVGVKHHHHPEDEGGEAIVPVEDLQATSAAIQNMVLAAHSLGLAAQWRTGEGAFDPDVKAWFGLTPSDEIAGIVYVGYRDPERDVVRVRRRQWSDKTEWRGWE
jgi:nitroreductase